LKNIRSYQWKSIIPENRCFIDLIERANIANRFNAYIFVSIHNANRNTAAYGTETYVMGLSSIFNLEAAKENSVITLEKDYKQKII
jgi:N-acetylmuramoyl-L-alanine amidase